MRLLITILFYFYCACQLCAQGCNFKERIDQIVTSNRQGAFSAGLDTANKLLACDSLSDLQKAELLIWKYKLNRNQLKSEEAKAAILRAKELLEQNGKDLDVDFRLMLAESSALGKSSAAHQKLLADLKTKIFTQFSDDHLSLGRYYFLLHDGSSRDVQNFLKALDHFEQLDSVPTFHMGLTLRALGNVHRDMGDLDESKQFYNRELAVYSAHYPGDHFNNSICHYNIGNVYYELLEYQFALDHYLKTHVVWENIYEQDHFRMKTLNEAIGDMYWELGDHSNALAYFNLATANEAIVNNDSSEQTIQLGDSLLAKGNYATALTYYREAVSWREKTYGKDHELTAACKSFLARAIRSSGDLRAALESYQEVIGALVPYLNDSEWTKSPGPEMEIKSRQYLLDALIAKGEVLRELYTNEPKNKYLEVALDTHEAAISTLEKIKNTQISESSKVFWTTRTRHLIEMGIETALMLYEAKQEASYLQKAFSYSERSKALLLLSSLYDQEVSIFSGVPNATIEQEKKFRNSINEYQGKINKEEKRCGEARTKLLDLYRQNLRSAQNEYTIFLQKMKEDYPNYYDLKFDPKIITSEEIQQELSQSNSTLLSYFMGDENIFVFHLEPNSIQVRKIENAKPIAADVITLYELVNDQAKFQSSPQKTYESFAVKAGHLYDVLVGPELKESDYDRLTIVPDGVLSYLPFELLLSSQGPAKRNYAVLAYLLNDFAVSYSPSSSIFMLMNEFNHKNERYMGFAPNYEGQDYGGQGKQMENLDFNTAEVNFAAKLFGGDSWIGKDVFEDLLKSNSANVGILHLAMHGEVEDEHPLLSKLYFNSSVNEDGMLHTYEIYGLEIPSQLVILSACNTARGKLVTGEGILSLERAFQYARSASLLSTLWKVDDAASAAITQQFLTGIKEGQPKDVALQQAKLSYLSSATPDKLPPFYWSSFKLTGSIYPLNTQSNPWYVWLGVGVLGICIALFYVRRRLANVSS